MFKIRELERDDIPVINTWRTDRNLIVNLGAPYRYVNREVDYKWYEMYLQNRTDAIRCAILNENENIIGLVSLINIDRLNQTADFHIMIGETTNREKGVGKYATLEILKHAFLDMNLNRVELSVLVNNHRALSLYEKVGFKREGIKRKAVYKNGVFIDNVIMAILKEDFSIEEIE